MQQANQPGTSSSPPTTTQQMSPPAQGTMPQPQPQPQPQHPPVPSLRQHDRPLRLWRLGIRITTASFVALSMILFLAHGGQAASRTSSSSYYSYSYYSYANYAYVSLPVLAFAMIWNIAEFITFCINKRGAHPGVHVGLDLVSFACLLSGGLVAIFRWSYYYYDDYYYDDDDDEYAIVKIAIAGAAMEIIACVFHFVLFVMACVATHRRRMRAKQELLHLHTNRQSMYPPGAYPPPPPGMVYMVTAAQPQPGYGQMPQQPQMQQQQQQRMPSEMPQQMAPPSTQSPVSAAAVPTHSPTPELEHNDQTAWNTHGAHPGQPPYPTEPQR